MNNKLIAVTTLVVAVLLAGGTFLLMRPKTDGHSPVKATHAPLSKSKGDAPVNELVKTDTVVGTGAEATAGKKISVHYTGWLLNGTKFDSSVDRGQPFSFTLGKGEVIKGWDQGFDGMKVGGKRTLTIPADLAYGASGQGSIPPNSPLKFDVELLGVE